MGGELQRITVARAILSATPYIVADEITVMLDPITQAQIWQTLRARVDAEGTGVLAVSHDQHLLGTVADRIIGLSELVGAAAEGVGSRPRDGGRPAALSCTQADEAPVLIYDSI